MAIKTLTVKLSEGLYDKFIETVTEEGGPWRSKRRGETSTDAIESAVTAALMLFLQNLDRDSELPEFRDYIQEKYPELDEDLITMIEDLIERKRQQVA
jgi:prenyltransferase beta subunit